MARPWSSFFWPGSKVLKNRLGITDGPRLEEAEYDVAELRMQQLLANPSLVTATDPVQRLQQVHAHLFGDLYDWAGELRDFDLSKGRSVFASHEKAGAMFRHGAKQLRPQTWTSRRRAVGDLADAFGWLNHAHPFREGNGRTSKVFMAHVAEQSPYRFDFARVSPEQWNAGSALSRPDLYAYAPDPTSLVPVFAAVTVERSAPQAGPDRAAQVRSALSASYPRSAADATRQTPQQGTQARRGTAGYRSGRGSGRE